MKQTLISQLIRLSICMISVSLFQRAEAAPISTSSNSQQMQVLPIARVKSKDYDAKPVCVRGIIVIKNGEDEFILQDPSDAIILFLPIDSLFELNLQEGMQVLVYGTIDYSTASRNRTELYADKIVIEKTPAKKGIEETSNKASELDKNGQKALMDQSKPTQLVTPKAQNNSD